MPLLSLINLLQIDSVELGKSLEEGTRRTGVAWVIVTFLEFGEKEDGGWSAETGDEGGVAVEGGLEGSTELQEERVMSV